MRSTRRTVDSRWAMMNTVRPLTISRMLSWDLTDPYRLHHPSRCRRVRRFNPRRVKIHRTYTVEEAARLFGVHKNTVRTWLKTGSRSTAATDPHPGTAAR